MIYLSTTYDANGFFRHSTNDCSYVGYKPSTYKDTESTTLFVWGHGCGGVGEGDMWVICPPSSRAAQKHISISMLGKDGKCWDADVDYKKVLAAIEDVKKYFNINKVILGGYSSGGDLSYYTAFFHSDKIAGVVINNSSPFLDSGSASQSAKLAATKYKFGIYQMSHTEDTTYKIVNVRNEVATLRNAGHQVEFIELPGKHWEATTATSGTNYDFIKYALPFIDNNNWKMPNTNPPVVEPPVESKILKNFAKSSLSVKAPGDQGFTSTKVVKDGYDNVNAGVYGLRVYTRTSWSGANGFCINMTFENVHEYDLTWEELSLDLRNHTISNFGNCTVIGTSGTVIVKPTDGTKTIPANNRVSINMCFNRAKDATNYYQVLVKSIKW